MFKSPLEFQTPFNIIALAIFALAVTLMLVVRRRYRQRGSVRFSSLKSVRRLPVSLRHRLKVLPFVLRILVLGFLLIGVARPRVPDKRTFFSTEGVAIQMVIDRSSSMREEMYFEGRTASRFEVARNVFTDFVLGSKRKELPGRPNDMIGLTSFALYPEENCPLTLDHESLVALMENIEPARKQVSYRGRLIEADPTDGTAIGDALYYAMLSLIDAEDAVEKSPKLSRDYRIKSKMIILLTDGERNRGVDPIEIAEEARKNDIKIYSIAVAPGRRRMRLFGTFPERSTREIRAAAELTGGQFFKATDGESLAVIYDRIDKLEKSPFSRKFTRYEEHYQRWWAVPMALALLTLEIILRNTVFRTVP